MLVQVVPALRVRRCPVVERVTSQLAWWLPSGPQAGEKFTVLTAVPFTDWLVGPKLPPKLTTPARDWPVVSSTQNLIVIWLSVTAEVPLLMTSSVSEPWLDPQVVNSISFKFKELVPQVMAVVAVGVGAPVGVRVAVAVTVRVAVEVTVLVAVEPGVGVLVSVGVIVAVLVAVEVTVFVAVEPGVKVRVEVGVRVAVPVAVAVAVLVGEEVGVEEGVAVLVLVGVEVVE